MVSYSIHNTDCLEFMKGVSDKQYALTLTSPPYNMGGVSLGYQPNSSVGQKHYGEYEDNRDEKDYVDWCNSVIAECLRISRYVFWNVQFLRSTRESIFSIQERFRNNLKDIFIWEKQAVSNITASSGGMAKGWEYVFMLGDDNLSVFQYNNFPSNGYVPNIKTWYKKEYFKEHHATFTTEMASYFIQNFTKENDTVFDPFSGMGTTGVSSIKLIRNYVGCEIDPKYHSLSLSRLKDVEQQPSFFHARLTPRAADGYAANQQSSLFAVGDEPAKVSGAKRRR